jgi:hypothetical protein
MKRHVFVTLLVLIMLPVVVLPFLDAPSGVVMKATIAAPNEPNKQGSIRIPNAGVDASLSLAHVDDTCCYTGLWNGGYIIGDARMFESVKVGDWADIDMPDCHLVLECVEIKHSIGQLEKPDGDVLIICGTKVYRFIVL